MINIKTIEQDYYSSFASHHDEDYKRHAVIDVFRRIHTNHKEDSLVNTNCGPSFRIEIIDTEDDGLPYPDVEDYKINREELNPFEIQKGRRWLYAFTAEHQIDQEAIDLEKKEDEDRWDNFTKKYMYSTHTNL